MLLARIQQARGQTAAAQDTLRSVAARLQRPLSLLEIQLWQARLAWMSGDIETARRWAAAHGQRRAVPHVQQEQTVLLLAQLQLNEQKPEAVLKLLEPWRSAARHNGRLRSELEILCVQALAYAGQENSARAHKTLTQALTLAQPKGYRRLFLDQGEPLAQLLQAIVPDLGKRPIATYATLLLRAFAATRSGQLARPTGSIAPARTPQRAKNSGGVAPARRRLLQPRNRPRVGGIHQHHQDASAEHLSQAQRQFPC